MRYMIITLLVLALMGGCTRTQKDAVSHEKETHNKTIWTAKSELFLEYDEPKPGSKAVFLVHLTNLKDFKPVSGGPLTLTFTPEQGEAVTVGIDKPEKPGIFKTDVTFKQQGVYTLTV